MFEFNKSANPTPDNNEVVDFGNRKISKSNLYLVAAGLALASTVIDVKEHASPVLDVISAAAWVVTAVVTFRPNQPTNNSETNI